MSVRWASELQNALRISEKLVQFHQWRPLKVYSSLSNARKPRPVFSLRYRGQEVGKIIDGDRPLFNITTACETNNYKSFGLITKSTESAEPKPFWNGGEARKFRKQFKDFDSKTKLEKMKSDEAWLQSIVFETMLNNSDVGYHACQPVLFNRFPFQCPVPISANKGVPKKSRGNIDILARRGQGNTHASIWELKKPGQCKTAFEQVYIYGVTFALMLRGKGGELWYRNMGFRGVLNKNKSITIDIVIMITEDRKKELFSHLNAFNDPLRLPDENIILRPYVAYYKWDKLKGKVNIQEPMDLCQYLKTNDINHLS